MWNDKVIEFKDRNDAGIQLTYKLADYKDKEGIIVLALPRGGVIIGFEIASYLYCPLDVIIIRKLGFPGNPELAIGAISENGTVILDKSIISLYRISEEYITREISRQKDLIEKRVNLYRKEDILPDLKGKIVILVDDGVATGATMKAAISTLIAEKIKMLIVAIPVAHPDEVKELKTLVDDLIYLHSPDGFMSVGLYYKDFAQVTDDEVVDMLNKINKK